MKILYDCFSCSPYYGSDEGIGWLWPYHMRKYHEIWVLVRKDRKNNIERYCSDHSITDIHFIYVDIPDYLNFYYKNLSKGKNGTLDFLAYQYLWQFAAYKVANRLHRVIGFDLVHHVCTNDFRLLGRMYLLNIPFVIGPVGGAQITPDYLEYYIREYKKKEKLRKILNLCFTYFPGYKKALKKAVKLFVSNQETFDFLNSRVQNESKFELMTEVGWSGNLPDIKSKNFSNTFTFIWAGRIEYRKGLELLFDVLDRLDENLEWKLILCGAGSELNKYKKIINNKTYNQKVKFTGLVGQAELSHYYKKANVFVFPSLRETTGTVIIEAMANGIPVIALAQGGAREVINESCGRLISGNTQEEILQNFADAMSFYIKNPSIAYSNGVNAHRRILEKYTWEEKVSYMNGVYKSILK